MRSLVPCERAFFTASSLGLERIYISAYSLFKKSIIPVRIGLYCFMQQFAALVAFALPIFLGGLVEKPHALALVIGSIGLVSVYFLPFPIG